jgi:hypothetical protein
LKGPTVGKTEELARNPGLQQYERVHGLETIRLPAGQLTDRPCAPALKSLLLDFEIARLSAFRRSRQVDNGIEIIQTSALVHTMHRTVPFFNKIYGLSAQNLSELPRLLSGRRPGYPSSQIEVYEDDIAGLENTLFESGYIAAMRNVIVAKDLTNASPAECRGRGVYGRQPLTIGPVDSSNIDLFSEQYLIAFEANSTPRADAISNMRNYLTIPGWSGYVAAIDAEPAGIAASYRKGDHAFLCAGATCKQFRSLGIHKTLIAHRLYELASSGTRHAVSYAEEGSQSLRNLQLSGFEVMTRRITYR